MDQRLASFLVRRGVARPEAERIRSALVDVSGGCEEELRDRCKKIACIVAIGGPRAVSGDVSVVSAPFPPSVATQRIDDEGVSIEGIFCGRCRSNDVRFRFSSARSADEGQVAFVLCLRCENEWKM